MGVTEMPFAQIATVSRNGFQNIFTVATANPREDAIELFEALKKVSGMKRLELWVFESANHYGEQILEANLTA